TESFNYNPDGVAKYFTPENKSRLETVRDAFARASDFNVAEIESILKATAVKLGVKPALLIHPTRLALTGSTAGPSLYRLLEVLGKQKALARLDRALVVVPSEVEGSR